MIEISRKSFRGLGPALTDIRDGWRRGPMWRAFALENLRQQYGRTYFGLGWIAISFAILVGIKGVFFSIFSTRTLAEFTIYVALGFLVYQFIVGSLMSGITVFTNNAAWMKNGPAPYTTFIFEGAAKHAILFLGNAVVAAIAMAALGASFSGVSLWAAPALAIYFITALWIQLLLGVVASRVRDIAQFVAAITRMLFFVTPIIWTYEEAAGIRRVIAIYNPLTHYIEILRGPLLNQTVSAESWTVVLSLTAIGSLSSILLFAAFRHRLPYWI